MNWQRNFLKPWVNDVATVIFLVLISIELYFPQVTRLSLTAIQSIIKIQQNGSLYFYFGRTPFSPLKLESAEFQLSSGLDRS